MVGRQRQAARNAAEASGRVDRKLREGTTDSRTSAAGENKEATAEVMKPGEPPGLPRRFSLDDKPPGQARRLASGAIPRVTSPAFSPPAGWGRIHHGTSLAPRRAGPRPCP